MRNPGTRAQKTVHGPNIAIQIRNNPLRRLIADLFLLFCAFSLALSAALATASPAVPAASVTSNAAIAVCFAPEQDCAAFAVRAIDNAEREILVSAYGLTTGSGIVEALVRAKQRGVDVRVMAGKTSPCLLPSGYSRSFDGG